MKKLVLAYSGGLDTSYCVKSLSQSGYEVHAVSVNTGGFDENEIDYEEEYNSTKNKLYELEDKIEILKIVVCTQHTLTNFLSV